MKSESMTLLGQSLQENRPMQCAEILLVFLAGVAIAVVGMRLAGDDPFARQAALWTANVLMLGMIWAGLRVRGQGWGSLGLSFPFDGFRALLRTLLQSIAVFAAALAAFAAGSVLAMNIAGAPQRADMSGYEYLQGNLPMLLLALAAVYAVSSFGEEVIYRGFLINRLAELGKGGKRAWGAAVLGSAAVFGLIHFDWGTAGMIQTAFMGLALGICYLVVKRKLWALVLAHAYMDTLLLVQLYLGPAA